MIALKIQRIETQNETHAVVLKFIPRKSERKACGLCKQAFMTKSKFDRFCLKCKEGSELYHFYETLPAC